MATKKSQTAKVTPKATKTVTTSTGKTKTVPAKKPATKPAPKTTKSKATNTKTTSTKPTKKPSKTGPTIACIIGAIAAIALVVIVIIMIVCGMNDHANLTVNTADGQKVTTEYVSFNDNKFKLKIPTSFHALSADEVKAQYPEGTDTSAMPEVIYSNEGKTIAIAVAPTDTPAANDNIKSSVETIQSVLAAQGSSQALTTDYYTQGNYNIASLKYDGKDIYEHIIFFAQDDKLTTITFSCENAERDNWQGVGNFIMKSLEFTK